MEMINNQKLHEKDTLDVPNEIIENILIRLPVKSLLRFKAVSEKWEATISDPVFARTHLQQSKRSARQYILTAVMEPSPRLCEKFTLVDLKNQEFQVESLLKIPSELGEVYFMYHLDGMLLLQCNFPSKGYPDFYALWNPSTATFIRFSFPDSLCYDPFFTEINQFCGLFYDPLIEDYKLVMGDMTRYAVFNCGNKRWTKLKNCHIREIHAMYIPQGIYFNGSLFWVWEIYSTNDRYIDFEIICYNTRDDEFKKLYQPKDVQDSNHLLRLALLGGHLCVYYGTSSSRILIMKIADDLESWMEFITIDNTPLMYLPFPHALFMTDENEIIIHTSGRIMAYNRRDETFTNIKNSTNTKYIVFPFVESLVLGFRDCRLFRRQREFQFDELREVFFLM